METKNGLIKVNSELRTDARRQLKGNWLMSVLLILVYTIITGISAQFARDNYYISVGLNLIIGGPLAFGLASALLNIVRIQSVKFENLFDGFKSFGSTFLLNLLIEIFVFLWSLIPIAAGIIIFVAFLPQAKSPEDLGAAVLLLIPLIIVLFIPAIIAQLRYSMAFYVLYDNPEISPMDAINKSKEMMKGCKGKLFLLYLSFIGWALLSLLTLGIGMLWVASYLKTSEANFYENLKKLSYSENSVPYVE